MSNKIKTLALLPIFALVFTACTLADVPLIGGLFGGDTVVSGPVTLNVWGLWEDPDVVNTLIQQYQTQKSDATINYEDRSVMELPAYKERVYTMVRDENSDTDVVLVHNSWVKDLAPHLAPAPNVVIDVNSYADRYFPVASESAAIDGRVYAIPAYYDGLVLLYNVSHFQEVGQTSPPTSWEEFRRLAQDLTVYENDTLVRGGAAMGTADNISHFSDILGLMWAQAGVDIDESIDTDFAADALVYYTNFARQDRVWNNSMPEASAAFTSEQVSMVFVPSWQVLDILQFMPDIENIGIAPVPQVSTENPVTWASFWMYAVPQNSSNSAAAWDYVNFLGEENQQQLYFNESAKVRLFGPMYASPSLSSQINNPFLQTLSQTAPFATSAQITARSGNRRQVDALQEAVNAVLGGSQAREALTNASNAINQ